MGQHLDRRVERSSALTSDPAQASPTTSVFLALRCAPALYNAGGLGDLSQRVRRSVLYACLWASGTMGIQRRVGLLTSARRAWPGDRGVTAGPSPALLHLRRSGKRGPSMSDTCPHGQPGISAALNAKFPTACHSPLPTCPRCQG